MGWRARFGQQQDRFEAFSSTLILAFELFEKHEGESNVLDAVAGEVLEHFERKVAVIEGTEGTDEGAGISDHEYPRAIVNPERLLFDFLVALRTGAEPEAAVSIQELCNWIVRCGRQPDLDRVLAELEGTEASEEEAQE